jgi:uncharacterized surface protein with fasciclin (FAS1) repeats
MRLTTSIATVALGAVAVSAQVNQTYLMGLESALTAANLTGLADFATPLFNTTEGMALLSSLQGSNKTILAPSNEAFANINSSVASNTTLVGEILSYHIINSSVTKIAPEGHTLFRSFFNTRMLPGNATQPVVFSNGSSSSNSSSSNSSMVMVLTATQNVTVTGGPIHAGNLMIYVIDQILDLPMTLSAAAGTLLPALTGLITQANLLEPLEAIDGVTIFAPNDMAIQSIASAVGNLTDTEISTILGNHVINGSVAYSTELASTNYTSAAGEPFKFTTNSTGTFVSSGNSTAKIVQADIPITNGVIHLIDGVLVNTAANNTAAAAAESSYSMAATMTPTATSAGGPIGSASSSGAASTSKSAGELTKASGALLPLTGAIAFLFSLI